MTESAPAYDALERIPIRARAGPVRGHCPPWWRMPRPAHRRVRRDPRWRRRGVGHEPRCAGLVAGDAQAGAAGVAEGDAQSRADASNEPFGGFFDDRLVGARPALRGARRVYQSPPGPDDEPEGQAPTIGASRARCLRLASRRRPDPQQLEPHDARRSADGAGRVAIDCTVFAGGVGTPVVAVVAMTGICGPRLPRHAELPGRSARQGRRTGFGARCRGRARRSSSGEVPPRPSLRATVLRDRGGSGLPVLRHRRRPDRLRDRGTRRVSGSTRA